MTQRHITRPHTGKERHAYANTTPFPNILLDEVMPGLKDTEWRLLCVIVRQTWGWQAGPNGQRKQSDWLTQKQLMARTGRNSEAVSRAIDVLVSRGLIEVCDEDGVLLATPQQRRRSGGRLYYSVKLRVQPVGSMVEHPTDQAVLERPTTMGALHSRGRKARSCARRSESGRCQSQLADRKIEVARWKIEVRKANTTKETGTRKYYVAPFLEEYRRLHEEYRTDATTPLSMTDFDEACASELLDDYGYDHLMRLLIRFFELKVTKSAVSDCGVVAFRANIRDLLIQEIKERLYNIR